MANRVTLSELAEKFRLSAQRLDEPCIDGHLTAISLYLTSWKTVARHLSLNAAEIEAIELDERSTNEMRQKTLQKWADKFAHRATYRSLITAFLEVNNAELATKVCEQLAPEQFSSAIASASLSPEDSVDLGSFHGVQSVFSGGDLNSPGPTETTLSQASNTGTSMLPYLETPGLNEAEKSALEGRLIYESRQILFKFNKLLRSTIKSLKELGVTPEELVRSLMCLETMLGDQELPLFHEHAERIVRQRSIDDIFWFLSGHISFINYDVIEHIIQAHEVDESKLREYKADLKEYCKRRVSECPLNKYAEPCTPDYTRVVIKLDKHLNKCKLLDINRFRDELSRILQVRSYALVFLTVEEGCTQLTFQIPSFIVDTVFPLSREQEASLKEERVLKLVCGVYTYSYSHSPKRQESTGDRNEPQDTTMKEGSSSLRIMLGQENFPPDTSMEIDAQSDLNSSVLGIEESIHPQAATVTERALGSLDFRSTAGRAAAQKLNESEDKIPTSEQLVATDIQQTHDDNGEGDEKPLGFDGGGDLPRYGEDEDDGELQPLFKADKRPEYTRQGRCHRYLSIGCYLLAAVYIFFTVPSGIVLIVKESDLNLNSTHNNGTEKKCFPGEMMLLSGTFYCLYYIGKLFIVHYMSNRLNIANNRYCVYLKHFILTCIHLIFLPVYIIFWIILICIDPEDDNAYAFTLVVMTLQHLLSVFVLFLWWLNYKYKSLSCRSRIQSIFLYECCPIFFICIS